MSQVWSRASEWGRTVAASVAIAFVVFLVVYVLVSLELYGPAFLALLAGGLAVVVSGYPVLITLERPVRVTPEQAVRDFYGALSHHVPHYRRMWLLLSDRGKYEGSFATFEGFHNYWKTRLDELKAGRASRITPLRFVVGEFRAGPSAGKTEVSASFTVQVMIRGRHDEGVVESIRVETGLVRGPDRMWYLDRGVLP